MNNTRTLAIVAIFMAATLVVGGTLATTTTTAFAYQKKNRGGSQDGSKDGNTVTIQANKQNGKVSGFDNSLAQEAENVICTHPASNSSCVSEGAAAGGGGGGGGVCNSPLVEAHIGTATGVLICVDPSLLTNPNNGGQCGSAIDVFIDSTHKCLPRSD